METLPDQIQELLSAARLLDAANLEHDVAAQMCSVDRSLRALQEIAATLVVRGVQEGMTQKRMADLLGVSPSTLRGARREYAA